MSDKLKEHPKVLAFVAVSAIVAIVGLGITFWPTGMPTMPETMEEVPALLESKAYRNLTPAERRPYVTRVSELMQNSDREQRRSVMQNSEQSRGAMRDMFRQMMVDRAKQFALADAATRQQMIIEDRARMEAMGGRRGPGGGRPGGGGDGQANQGNRGDRPERTEAEQAERREQRETQIEEWVNEGNGQDWALIREYMQQVRPR